MACSTALYLQVLQSSQSRQWQHQEYPQGTGKNVMGTMLASLRNLTHLLRHIILLCTESKQLLIQYHVYKRTICNFKSIKNSAAVSAANPELGS